MRKKLLNVVPRGQDQDCCSTKLVANADADAAEKRWCGCVLQVEGTSRHSLVVNLVWDADCTCGKGPSTLQEASEVPLGLLSTTDTPIATDGTWRPLVDIESSQHEPNLEAWHESVSNLLHALQGKEGSDTVDSNAQVHDKLPESAIQVRNFEQLYVVSSPLHLHSCVIPFNTFSHLIHSPLPALCDAMVCKMVLVIFLSASLKMPG